MQRSNSWRKSNKSTQVNYHAYTYRFFTQPMEDKLKITQEKSKYYNGYKGPKQTNISPGEGIDVKESVSCLPIIPCTV